MAELEGIISGWSTGEWVVPEWSFDGNPALIINHMQYGIAGTAKMSGAPYAQEKAAMDKLDTINMQKKLIAAFRERNLPIAFVAVISDPIGYLPKWGFIFEMSKLTAPKGYLNNPELDKMCEIIPELGRRPDEPVFYHTGHSPLTGCHLDEHLRQFGVRDIVLTGWTAHSTLYNSMLQFTNRWYSVVVPKDATGAPERDADCADIVLRKMMRQWGLVTTVDDVIAHLPYNK
jgi:nicotinamidase-related amidase